MLPHMFRSLIPLRTVPPLLVLLALVAAGCASSGYTWRFRTDADLPHQITLTAPADGAWSSAAIFQLKVALADDNATQVLGQVTQRDRTLVFTPQFPLMAGQTYRATYTFGDGGPAALFTDYRVPAKTTAAPRVTDIFPSGQTVPANHLKFYIHFSQPMQQGNLLQQVRLLHGNGSEVPEPFRETELWSPDGRRLTLWFHPGRQKTGVNLNVELGPVLESGGIYHLVLSGKWASTAGVPLGLDVRKTLRAGAPDRAQPDVARWKYLPPEAGTRQPLQLELLESLDWALLHSQLTVETGEGQPLAGEIAVSGQETRWAFTPAQPWRAGDHRITIGAVLEDLAGNNLERPFEVNLQAPTPTGSAAPRHLPFVVRPR